MTTPKTARERAKKIAEEWVYRVPDGMVDLLESILEELDAARKMVDADDESESEDWVQLSREYRALRRRNEENGL